MHIVKSIEINCSKEELWAWLTEFEKLQKWNSTILKEEHISSGEVGPGYVTRVLIKEGKSENWYENEILKYDTPSYLQISLKGANLGKGPMYIDYKISEKENSVKLDYENNWKPVGLMLWLFHPIINKMASKNTDKALAALKECAENS